MSLQQEKAKLNLSAALCTTALLSAIVIIMTAYILHIPIGVASGGYIHIGDSFIFLAACLLPQPYALMVGAIGAGISDLLTAPIWTPASVIIKILVTLAFTSHGKIICRRNVLAAILALPITLAGYYFAEVLIFGNWQSPLIALPFNALQEILSIIIFLALGATLDKAGFRSLVLRLLHKH